MSKKLKINLSLLNFTIFLLFTILTIGTGTFLVYLKNSSSSFKGNIETLIRSEVKLFLDQVSLDLNNQLSEGNISFDDDDQLIEWAKENLKYSKSVTNFDNIALMRVYYDQNTNKLDSYSIWKLNYSEDIIKNDSNSNVYKELLEGKYTDIISNSNILDNDNNKLFFEWSNVPNSDIHGLNKEDKLVAGKWNPKYSKIVIGATFAENRITSKYENLFSGINGISTISKCLICTLLALNVSFMTLIIWKQKKNIFIRE